MYMSGSEAIFIVVIGMVVMLFIFLIIRELVCWYWKINRMVELMASIDESLKQMPAVAQYDRGGQRRHAA
jgi:hypothetical protein